MTCRCLFSVSISISLFLFLITTSSFLFSLLWFKRRLPQYFCKWIEMILMLTADHGPAVAGAHNTIVCARLAGVKEMERVWGGGGKHL